MRKSGSYPYWVKAAVFFCLTVSTTRTAQAQIPEPDQLVPLGVFLAKPRPDYRTVLQQRFQIVPSDHAWMLVRPTLSGRAEYAVRLHGGGKKGAAAGGKIFLTCSTPDKHIGYWLLGTKSQRAAPEPRVASMSVELPRPLAVRVTKLWSRMLLLARPSSPQLGKKDGIFYEFGADPMRGETWSPQERKSPLLFVELGESMARYCKAPPQEHTSALAEIDAKATALEEYLDSHPEK